MKGILSDDEINYLVSHVQDHGGLVSFRSEEDGSQSPYELNCSYIDTLSHPDEEDILRIKRMLLSQGTVLAMPGVPGIYFHSLVGSRNYHDGVKHTGINRSINREKFHIDWLENELSEQNNLSKIIFDSYRRIISIRINEKAFNPFGNFSFFDLDPRLFAIQQACSENKEYVFAIHNFSSEQVKCTIPDEIALPLKDLLSSYEVDQTREVLLEPYQMMWLKGSI